jgi:hypothetical protein
VERSKTSGVAEERHLYLKHVSHVTTVILPDEKASQCQETDLSSALSPTAIGDTLTFKKLTVPTCESAYHPCNCGGVHSKFRRPTHTHLKRPTTCKSRDDGRAVAQLPPPQWDWTGDTKYCAALTALVECSVGCGGVEAGSSSACPAGCSYSLLRIPGPHLHTRPRGSSEPCILRWRVLSQLSKTPSSTTCHGRKPTAVRTRLMTL